MIRVLIVDDNHDDYELTKLQLENLSKDVKIEWASSGKAALAALEETDFDCVLCDYQMPGLNGLHLLKHLRGIGTSVPFIFLTGQGSEAIAAEALRSGADDYFTKEEGFAHYHRLLNSIHRVISSHRGRLEKVRAEEALRRSENQYRKTIDSLSDAIHVVGRDLRIVLANRRIRDWCSQLGLEKKQEGKKIFEAFPFLPDRIIREYEEVFEKGDILETEEVSTVAGREITTEVIKIPVFEGDKVTRVVTAIRDITEVKRAQRILKESEENYRNLIGQSNDAIYLFYNWKFEIINDKFQEMFGVTLEDVNKPGFDVMDLVAPKSRDYIEERLKRLAEGGNLESTRYEFTAIGKHGNEIDVENSVSYMKYKEGYAVQGIMRNITKRKMTEEKIALLSTVVDSMRDGVAIFDLEGEIKYINKALTEQMDYSFEELLGKTIDGFVPESDLDRYREYRRLAVTGRALPAISGYKGLRKDGTEFYLDVTPTVLKDAEGEPSAIVAVCRDMTERRLAEERLRESEARYRFLINSADFTIALYDKSGILMVANKTFAQYLGKSVDELVGKTIEELFPGKPDVLRERINEVIESGKGCEYKDLVETVVARRWFWSDVQPARDGSGNVFGVQVIGRDITEQKRAEEEQQKLLAVIENSSDLIGLASLDGKVFYLNEAGRKLVGLESLEEARSKVIFDFVNKDARRLIQKEVMPTLLNNGSVRGENRIRHFVTKELFDVEFNVFLLKSPETGEPSNIAVVIKDISERKRAEDALVNSHRQLERRTNELEAVNEELEAFSYSVSHDLRAPLRHISGYSQALLEDYKDKLDEEGLEYLSSLMRAGEKMGRLIDALLRLSKYTSGELKIESVDLSAGAEDISANLKKSEPKRVVEFIIAEDLVADADAKLIEVVLDNLLRNSWKYTSRIRNPEIEFGISEIEGTRTFFVRDNGAGFDTADAGRLFIPFSRIHNENDFEGTGIGLATVQRIIHRHGGRVWAEGRKGKGATFYFTLP